MWPWPMPRFVSWTSGVTLSEADGGGTRPGGAWEAGQLISRLTSSGESASAAASAAGSAYDSAELAGSDGMVWTEAAR